MINVIFFIENQQNNIFGFEISGHANYNITGKDIVCSAVSSCVFMTINCITDILHVPAKIKIIKNEKIYIKIQKKFVENCQNILRSLELHLINLENEYKNFLSVRYLEV